PDQSRSQPEVAIPRRHGRQSARRVIHLPPDADLPQVSGQALLRHRCQQAGAETKARTLMIALTHLPSPFMAACQRTYVPAEAINLELARRQHADYCRALADCGAQVRTLDVNSAYPDCTFIEDTAIVLDEVAILCPMGTDSRRAEAAGVES